MKLFALWWYFFKRQMNWLLMVAVLVTIFIPLLTWALCDKVIERLATKLCGDKVSNAKKTFVVLLFWFILLWGIAWGIGEVFT